jgi:putative Holliday junction resolvase
MRVLAIDYGRRRIGLALSDATGLLARPWKTISTRGGARQICADLAAEVDQLRHDSDGLGAIVIGFPRRLSGEANEQTPVVEAIAAQLRVATDLPVVLQDERLTSREAESLLSRREKDWRKRKPVLDATAAAVILQDYLDTRPRMSAAHGGDGGHGEVHNTGTRGHGDTR